MTMENGSQPLIRLDAVSKVFVTDEVETHALQSVHFDVKKGEYLSISGPSGCGKSTLLAILGLLDTPTDGTYYLNGKPVTGLKLSERARIRNREIGFIFQAFNLIGDLTVYENVELPLTYRGMPGAERKRRVQEALERVGMSHRMKHYPSQLSGGQQQRVAVARALSGDPLILLAARKLRRVMLHAVRHPHALQGLLDAPLALRPRHAAVSQRQFHVLVHGKIADQVEGLEDETYFAVADARPLAQFQAGNRLPVQIVSAVRRRIQQPEDGEQSRLSAAGRTRDRKVLPFLHVKVNALQGVSFHFVGHEDLTHGVQANQRLRAIFHRHL